MHKATNKQKNTQEREKTSHYQKDELSLIYASHSSDTMFTQKAKLPSECSHSLISLESAPTAPTPQQYTTIFPLLSSAFSAFSYA